MLRCVVTRTTYLLHGCTVQSELPLLAARAAQGVLAGDSPLVVELGESRTIPAAAPAGAVLATIAHNEHSDRTFYTAVSDGGELVFRVHGCCDVVAAPSRSRLVCHLDPAADPELVAVYLEGMVLAFLLGMQGEPVLHASAVSCAALGGRGVAIAGGAGVGKSTVTALLCAAGCTFVTDDLLRLGLVEGRAVVRGGCSELRLRTSGDVVLDAFAEPGPPVRTAADGRLAVRLPYDERESVDLVAVVLPWPSRELGHVELERLAPADALVQLARSPKLEGWRSRDVLAMQLDALTRLATTTPVLRAKVPWSPMPTLEGARELLAALAAAIGDR